MRTRARADPETRFFAQVDITGFCWLWNRALTRKGYAMFKFDPQQNKAQAHRWIYEHLVGPIPDGLVLDHLCRIRHCVNPDHVEPVTNVENVRRGNGDYNKNKLHCKRGHSYTGDNVYVHNNRRHCRACRALTHMQRKQK